MYNVGSYTISDWKVLWREQSSIFQSAIVGKHDACAVIPDHKLMLVPCDSRNEACYISGLLNSSPSLLAISSYAMSTATTTHVLENIDIRRFNIKNDLHNRISVISSDIHKKVLNGRNISPALDLLDDLTAGYWSITNREMRAIREALAELTPTAKADTPESDSED